MKKKNEEHLEHVSRIMNRIMRQMLAAKKEQAAKRAKAKKKAKRK